MSKIEKKQDIQEQGVQPLNITIPEGKIALWNKDGMLQLFDKPKEVRPITERIRTFEDARDYLLERSRDLCLGDTLAARLVNDWAVIANNSAACDENIAYHQLTIIAYALNEGRQPELTKGEERWFPYFVMWTADEVSRMNEEGKDARGLLLWGGHASHGAYGGVSCSDSNYAWADSDAGIGSRLAYRTEALADYAGRQFATIYARWLFGEKGAAAKPWREFEKEENADGEN